MKPLIQEQALTDRVREAIVTAIVNGTYQSGERLAQEEIAARLGVSRQPVSHALNVLKQQGILVELGRKGLTVAPMDPDRLEALYQVRGALDGLAARLVAERLGRGELSAADLRPLADLIETQRDPETSVPLSQRVEADIAFHLSLYRLSGNPAIEEITHPHWVHFRRSMQEVLKEPSSYPPIWRQHQTIFDAITAADPAAAEERSRNHVQTAAAKAAKRLRNANHHQETTS